MAFNNTSSPLKPTKPPKYIVPMRISPTARLPEYYLTPELEKEFSRLYPITMNPRLMELFGLSHTTLHRFARELGLKKDMNVIHRKHAQQVKNICEKNGYYDSIRGKSPSEATLEGIRRKHAEGFCPLRTLKEKHPRKYKKYLQARSEQRKALMAKERKLLDYGLTPHTNLHIVQQAYTRSQSMHRVKAKKRGYILGDPSEWNNERFTIYYDSNTKRTPTFERNCNKNGFTFRHISTRR